jgi:hypothetical protein
MNIADRTYIVDLFPSVFELFFSFSFWALGGIIARVDVMIVTPIL